VIIDRLTGKVRPAQIFVAMLGASNFTYVEASWTQALGDWIGAHTSAFEAIGRRLAGGGRRIRTLSVPLRHVSLWLEPSGLEVRSGTAAFAVSHPGKLPLRPRQGSSGPPPFR
jgi:hypothetical protein